MTEFNSDDFEVDDLMAEQAKKKKKLNSKKKGNRVELGLCKVLTEHFGCSFSRSVGSGNGWGRGVNLPSHAKTTFTGDICPPEGFLWVIESKGGYEDDIDLNAIIGENNSQLQKFINQVMDDHGRCGRKPIVVWKRSRKPALAMIQQQELPAGYDKDRMFWNGWVIVNLVDLLQGTPRTYWFEEGK
jgi:hypothetical protein